MSGLPDLSISGCQLKPCHLPQGEDSIWGSSFQHQISVPVTRAASPGPTRASHLPFLSFCFIICEMGRVAASLAVAEGIEGNSPGLGPSASGVTSEQLAGAQPVPGSALLWAHSCHLGARLQGSLLPSQHHSYCCQGHAHVPDYKYAASKWWPRGSRSIPRSALGTPGTRVPPLTHLPSRLWSANCGGWASRTTQGREGIEREGMVRVQTTVAAPPQHSWEALNGGLDVLSIDKWGLENGGDAEKPCS